MSERNVSPSWPLDWRDAAAYERERTMLEWRWEFLRRRKDYQEAFAECDRRISRAWADNPDLVHTYQHGSPQESWDASEELTRRAGVADLLKPFGLAIALNPAKTYDDDRLSINFERPDWGGVIDLKEGDVDELHQQGIVIMSFDLKYNMDDQLELTRAYLQDEQRNRGIEPAVKRIHPERWAEYLRVLDARAAGCFYSEIARQVLGLADLNNDEMAARAKQKHTDALTLQTKITS